ncbi:MAG TPA: helix-turn-helix transcriptional regulator [Acidimicrobiales bacterium]|nr:helix-turn-helix transcriptional regulator [Acidimicrobiales bacterium]
MTKAKGSGPPPNWDAKEGSGAPAQGNTDEPESAEAGGALKPLREISDRARGVGEFIRDQRSAARLSLRNVAKSAGISNPYLSQIERGLRKPSAEILGQIARALRISAETLYVQAGILEERGEADLEDAIRRTPDLSDEQRQALLNVYRSMRSSEQRTDGEAEAQK